MRRWRMAATTVAVLALLASGCGGGALDADDGAQGGSSAGAEAAGEQEGEAGAAGEAAAGAQLAGALDGAGATFPNPVFQDWIYTYQDGVQPGVTINYQSIGSGGGIEQFLLQTVDFGSSERYLRDDALAEARAARGCEAVQFPVLFGAVTLAFGDDALDGLVLSPEVVADVFERRITTYDDPAIAALNPDRDLPAEEIVPVHRSDGSGTTSVFTTYLDHSAAGWTLGEGTEVQWPADTVGGQGNEGVTAGIQQNPGGVGYVNQAYALVNDLPTARVVNADGNAVAPTLEATTAALDGLDIPDDFQFDILDVGGDGYPIVGANWVFVYECGYDAASAAILRDFWTWATQSAEAGALARELGYAPLGDALKERVQAAIERIEAGP